jgi:hypothetical protein
MLTYADVWQAYAKSLHYKEMEFVTSPATAIHSLISVNNHLGHTEAVVQFTGIYLLYLNLLALLVQSSNILAHRSFL